jgi:hypothetical protein
MGLGACPTHALVWDGCPGCASAKVRCTRIFQGDRFTSKMGFPGRSAPWRDEGTAWAFPRVGCHGRARGTVPNPVPNNVPNNMPNPKNMAVFKGNN